MIALHTPVLAGLAQEPGIVVGRSTGNGRTVYLVRFSELGLDQVATIIGNFLHPHPMAPDYRKSGVFVDHTCYRCRDGELPCPHKGKERNCDTLRARND